MRYPPHDCRMANIRTGRITERDLSTELTELYGLVEAAVADGDGSGGGELQAALAEMSRNLARQGFRPAETAISVFSLKQALHEHSEFGPREDDVAFIALRRAR